MGSIEGGSSTQTISCEDIVPASPPVNEYKRSKRDSKRKFSKKGKEVQEGENTITVKKVVVWTPPLRNLFLEAITYIGLEKAVPKNILEFMKEPGLTRTNVASHLQKHRMYLKKVAGKGSTTALRSSFASGRSTDFPSRGTSSSNTVFQAGLFGNQTSFQCQSLFGKTSPQANQATYGAGSKGLMKDTNSTILYQHKSQTRSNLYGKNIAASSLNNFGASARKSSFSAGYESMAPLKNPCSTFGVIRINDAEEFVGTGQASQNANVLNVGYGLHNGTGNQDVTGGFMGYTAFPYLAPGESSSSVFDTAFAGANEEAANPSVLPPLSQQQYGLGNNGQNDFTFRQMNNASVFGNIAHPTEKLGQGSKIDPFNLTDFQFSYQGGESVMNPKLPNNSYQAELNLPTNQSQGHDLSSAYGVEERASWIQPYLEQLQEIEEVVKPDLYSNANRWDYYYPNFNQNPNQQQGDGNFINSDLNGLDQLENFSSGNQDWDDEFIDSLFSDCPF